MLQPAPSAERPGITALIPLAVVAAAYLFVGAVVVWAYSTSVNSALGRIYIEWKQLPTTTLCLWPGLVLGTSVIFVRTQKWAVLLAFVVLGLSLLAIAYLLVRTSMVLPHILLRGGIFLVVLGIWFGLVVAGLVRLRRQWVWLRDHPLPKASGFAVISKSEA